MTRKEFETLRPLEKVEFVKSGKLNGMVVTISRISGDEIIAPNPLIDNRLCAWKYTHFIRATKQELLPDSCKVLCRKMTKKSIPGFGKFADLPVGDILKAEPKWLVWAYGKFEKIDFTEDVLQELGCRRIEKPGMDENIVREWLANQLDQMTPEERKMFWIKHNAGAKRAAKAELMRAAVSESRLRSRSQLQAANHGHIKIK